MLRNPGMPTCQQGSYSKRDSGIEDHPVQVRGGGILWKEREGNMPSDEEMKKYKEEAEKAEDYQRCQALLRIVGEALYKLKGHKGALALMEIHLSLLVGALKALLEDQKRANDQEGGKITPFKEILQQLAGIAKERRN
jgi:hypothetical protein